VVQLEARLGELERMLVQGRTRLVVLDSVAALHRDLLGQAGYDAPERSRGLTSLAAVLKAFSHRHGVAVVAVNQVSDVVDEAASLAAAQGCGPAAPLAGGGAAGAGAGAGIGIGGAEAAASSLARQLCAVFSNGRWMRPALGVVWSSCVTTRIMMTHPRSEPPPPQQQLQPPPGAGGWGGGGSGGGGGSSGSSGPGAGAGGGAGEGAGAGAGAGVGAGIVRSAAAGASAAAAAPAPRAELDLSDLDLGAWDREVAAEAAQRLALQQHQQRQQQQEEEGQRQQRGGRLMYLLQSPELPPAVVAYEITSAGVVGVGEVMPLACW